MKCMLCLGVVVRLNSFRGFNLAHTSPKDGKDGPPRMAELVHQPQVELHSEFCVVHPELQLVVAVRLGVHGRLGRKEVLADL